LDLKFHTLGNHRTPDMDQMVVDLFLRDSQDGGKLQGRVFTPQQQVYQLLARGLGGMLVCRFHVTSLCPDNQPAGSFQT